MKNITKNIKNCTACNRFHKNLTFQPLSSSIDNWTHWTFCPYLHQPILSSNIVNKKPNLTIRQFSQLSEPWFTISALFGGAIFAAVLIALWSVFHLLQNIQIISLSNQLLS